MSEPFIGQVYLVGYNFATRGFAFCEGQLLAISQNTALFSLLGTTFGGDGRTTFGLPDLRGRAPIGVGRGPGLSDYRWGQKGGTETTTLITPNLPSHNHAPTMHAELGNPDQTNPSNNMLASGNIYRAPHAGEDRTLASGSIKSSNVGNNQPFNNMQPYLAMYYQIALVGVFPSRS